MKRCVIIGGAPIENYKRTAEYLRGDDYVVYCDSGLRHMEGLGVKPDLIVGDFDSHENPMMETETIVLPCEKDDTDTVFAVKEALKRGFDDFLLLGAAGGRLDHTLANVSILLDLHSRGKKAVLVDDFSEMSVAGSQWTEISSEYTFFSLLNISGTARGVTIENAKYPLEGAEITCEYQYGVSNEVLPEKTARVKVEEGRLLLIKVLSLSAV